MKYCTKCGKEIKGKVNFCGNCGAKIKSSSDIDNDIFDKIGDNVEKILDTDDTTKKYNKKDIEDNKGYAALSYIGPLAILTYVKDKNSKYVKYHAIQGMNLLFIELCFIIVANLLSLIKITSNCTRYFGNIENCVRQTPTFITLPIKIIGLLLFALSIIGFVFSLLGKAKKIPLVEKINLFR